VTHCDPPPQLIRCLAISCLIHYPTVTHTLTSSISHLLTCSPTYLHLPEHYHHANSQYTKQYLYAIPFLSIKETLSEPPIPDHQAKRVKITGDTVRNAARKAVTGTIPKAGRFDKIFDFRQDLPRRWSELTEGLWYKICCLFRARLEGYMLELFGLRKKSEEICSNASLSPHVHENHPRVRERKRERRPLKIRSPEVIVAGMDTRNGVFPERGIQALATQFRRFRWDHTISASEKKGKSLGRGDVDAASSAPTPFRLLRTEIPHHPTTIRPQPPYHPIQKHPIHSIRLLVCNVFIEPILSRSMCLTSSSFRILPSPSSPG